MKKGSFTKNELESHFFPLCNSDRLKIGGLRSAAIFVFRNCNKTFSWSVYFGLPTDFFLDFVLVWGSHESTKHGSFRNSFFGAIVEPAWILPPSLFCSYRGLPDPLSRRGRQLVLSCLARLILAICSRHRLFLSLELDWCAEACTNLSWI